MRKAVFYLSEKKGRILKTLALSMLIIMFLPNMQGFSQYLPNLVGSFATASDQTSTTGSPLLAGTVYDPTMGGLEVNGSLASSLSSPSSCPSGSDPVSAVTSSFNGTSQPLVPILNSWNASLRIPTLFIMGEPAGSFAGLNYTVNSRLGSASVMDQNGNDFQGYSYLIDGLPASVLSSSLVGNSTEAMENLTVSTPQISRATLSITYSVEYAYCEPQGLKVSFSGNLGQSIVGSSSHSFGISFLGAPASVSSTRALFESRANSASEIAFDWSDSLAQSPAFNATSSALTWHFSGSSFAIDPEIVANSSVQQFGEYAHHLWYADNLWWLFYSGQHTCSTGPCDYSLNYSTSYNGIQWTSEGSFATYVPPNNGAVPQFDVAVLGYYIMYVEDIQANNSFSWKEGDLQANGSISWSGRQQFFSPALTHLTSSEFPSISFDNSNRTWLVIPEQSGTSLNGAQVCPCYSDVYYDSLNGGMKHSELFTDSSGSAFTPSASQILPLANGEMALVTCVLCDPSNGTTHSGSSITAAFTSGQGNTWGTPVTLSSGGDEPLSFASDTLGNNLVVAYVNYGLDESVKAASLSYGSTTPSVSVIDSTMESCTSSSSCMGLAITKDGDGNLAATIGDPISNSTKVYKSTNGASSWTIFETPSFDAGYSSYSSSLMQLPSVSQYGLTSIAWEQGGSSAKNIVFASFPTVVPNPTIFGNSWSRPGGSPYETYFSHINDAISPGNGLLVVEQSDLDLPGRNGLDLVISRVFETPFAFGPGNLTAGYDNYTLANVGLGWQLNFPWMGANYLHLADGQAYVYNWNTSGVFENHAGTDFVMYHWENTNNTFDLYMADGTRYHFFSNESLAYETDPTGNNTITFYYTSGHISSIVDSIGRTVSFTYDSGELTSISSGGITYSYGYSSKGDLVNVTDPLSRVTKYSYSNANNWLLTSINYPTGGELNYTYGKELVGTEDYSYYVTLANVYTSTSELDESNSYSYAASNGVISYTNETTADQSGRVQSYDLFQFPTGNSVYLVPITLSNTQTSPVVSGTQVLLNVNWYAYSQFLDLNLQNVEFTDSSNVPLYAWCESSCYNFYASSNVWVKLDQAIPAGQSITIYLAIDSLSANNYAAGFLGECPTCSPYYGEYDNGAQVFSAYANGNTPLADFTAGSGITISQNDSVAYAGSSSGNANVIQIGGQPNLASWLFYLNTASLSASQSYVSEANAIWYTHDQSGDTGITALIQSPSSSPNALGVNGLPGSGDSYLDAEWVNHGTESHDSTTYGSAGHNWIYGSLTYTPGLGSYSGYAAPQLYSTSGGYSMTESHNPLSSSGSSLYVGVLGDLQSSFPANSQYNFIRARINPPSGVMPSVVFGAIQKETSSLSFNPSSPVYVPVTITNYQNTTLGSGTQVLLSNIDWQNYQPFVDNNLQNAQFYDSSYTPVYAWCESGCSSSSQSSNVWIKTDQSISSGQSVTYYLGIGSSSTNNLSPTGYWGEEPNATITYGQYDNGGKVFSFYNNFAGTSLPSGWTATGLTYSVNNGFTASASSGSISELITSSAQVTSGNAIDYYGSIYQNRTSSSDWVELGAITSSSSNNYGSYLQSYANNTFGEQTSSAGNTKSGNIENTQFWGVWSVELLASSSVSDYQLNYGSIFNASSHAPSYPSYFGLRAAAMASFSPNAKIQWIRERALPPNDVMPLVSMGAPLTQTSHSILDANRARIRTVLTTSDSYGRAIESQTFSTPPSSSPFEVDGSNETSSSNAASLSVPLTTSSSPDVIVVYSLSASTGITMSISDANSLSWNTRASDVWTGHGYLYEFYAIATSPLHSDSITVTQSKSDGLDVIAFGVSGANTNAPFDPYSGLPAFSSGDSASPSLRITTSNSNDLILGFGAVTAQYTLSVGSGYNMISTAYPTGSVHGAAESLTSSTSGSQTVDYSASGTTYWGLIGDAIVSGGNNNGNGNSGTSGVFGIDGTSAAYSSSATSVTAPLSTTSANDVIIAYCETGSYSTSVSVSGGGLTWHTRVNTYKISQSGNNFAQMYEAYAISSGALSSAQIKCTLGAANSLSLTVFGISGANTTSPFDPKSGLPAENQGSSAYPSVLTSTSNPDDMIIGFLIRKATYADSPYQGFALIEDGIGHSQLGSTEYATVSSTLSSTPVGYSLGGSEIWGMIADAIVQAQGTNPPGLLYTTYSNYDNWGNMISSTDALGHTTFYSYANTNDYDIFEGAGGTTFTDKFYTNNTVVSKYIHTALVGQASLQNGLGSHQMETYFDYSSVGEMLHQRVLYINGTTDTWLNSTNKYDFYGNVISSIDPLGRTSSFQYSSTYDHAYLTNESSVVNAKTISTTYTYNLATGWMLTETNGNSGTTTYTYDNLGRETSVSYPPVGATASEVQYAYDDKNNAVNVTDPNGNLVRQYYDGLGREVEVQTFNGTHAYSEEYYTYNYQNQVANHTTPAGDRYSYFYDVLGRQTEEINANGTKSFTTYDTTLNSTTFSVIQTDASGNPTYYYYNWANELTAVVQSPSSGVNFATRYSYDLSGNLLNTTDANSHTTSYTYDNLNRLVLALYPDGTNSTNSYDSVGNVIQTKDPIGNVVKDSYDSLNRLIEVKYPNDATINYTYDNDGNKLSMVQSNPSTSSYYTYDAMDRLTNETDVISGVSYTALYSYDKASNVVQITYPDSSMVKYSYDFLNRISTLGSIANLTYTLDSKISTILYANGIKTSYTYNSLDEAKSIYSFSGSTEMMGLNYTYDNVGNVVKINNENYTYNNMNELNSSSGPWGTTSYSYDGIGNMLNMTVGGTTTKYGYDNYNRMTSAGSSVTLTYDSNGNLKKIVNGSTTWNYYYNANNELTGVSKNSVNAENSTYNMDSGNRIEETTGSNSMIYTYQGSSSDILYQKNLTSSTILKNYYADGLLLGTSLGSSTYYLLDDLLGSVRSVTTSSPISTVYSSNYKPYGNSYSQTQSMSLPSIFDYYYTHKPYDSTTGLYYYGARFYDPAINRFITEDQSGYSTITNPITLNQYVYALNNPETNDDPSGHMIDMWSSGSTNMEPPAAPPAKPPVVTVPPKTPQSGEGSYRWGNMISNTNHNNYAASTEKYTIPKNTQPVQTKMDQSQYTSWWINSHLLDIAGDISIAVGLITGIAISPVLFVPLIAGGIVLKIEDSFINHDSKELVSALTEEAFHFTQEIISAAILASMAVTVAAAMALRYGVLGFFTGGLADAASIVAAVAGSAYAFISTYNLYVNDYNAYKNSAA